ncbi:MAG: hypothetical protein Q4C85_11410, partial [Actinomyces sp.]|nr:hypothetical protein [Actinomyces sp.]
MTTPDPSTAPLSSFLGGWTRAQAGQDGAPAAPAAGGPEPEDPDPDATGPAQSGTAEAASAEDPGAPEAPSGPPDDEDHVIEVADPRDFADDAGPQYEDEDFDDESPQDEQPAGATRPVDAAGLVPFSGASPAAPEEPRPASASPASPAS